MKLLNRLQSTTPKRILALDGGGIKGAITLGFLARMEKILKDRYKDQYGEDFRLHHYFDLIGGTSTGSIIAAGLAKGMSVKELEDIYLQLGEKVFADKRGFIKKYTRAKFDASELEYQLKKVLKDTTLGSTELKTGLCIVTKRADTGSTWPFHNHPKGAYYDANKGILVRNIVRASAAAPTYFDPISFDVGLGEPGAFVDGGVSMANNPALQLFLLATLEGFKFKWSKGADQLMIVSVGTGIYKNRRPVSEVLDSAAWDWATEVPNMLMSDASNMNELILQGLSQSPTARVIDTEIGDLSGDLIGDKPSLHYIRYNVRLEQNELNNLKLAEYGSKVASLREMDIGENVGILSIIGRTAAEEQVQTDHFPTNFDLSKNHKNII